MNNMISKMSYLFTHEQASVIRNLLNKERIEYEYCDYTRKDAHYFKTITDALRAMDHPQKH